MYSSWGKYALSATLNVILGNYRQRQPTHPEFKSTKLPYRKGHYITCKCVFLEVLNVCDNHIYSGIHHRHRLVHLTQYWLAKTQIKCLHLAVGCQSCQSKPACLLQMLIGWKQLVVRHQWKGKNRNVDRDENRHQWGTEGAVALFHLHACNELQWIIQGKHNVLTYQFN